MRQLGAAAVSSSSDAILWFNTVWLPAEELDNMKETTAEV
jgi:hypothetical protein